MFKSEPSPNYFKYLWKERQLKIVLIGSSGCGKSRISKKIAESSSEDEMFLLDKEKFKIDFDVSSIDLKIKDLLFNRIIEDNLLYLKDKLSQKEQNLIEPLTKLKKTEFTDAQELSFISEWMGNILFSYEWYKYSSYWYLKAENDCMDSINFLLGKYRNGIIDSTGSVFSVDNSVKKKLNSKTLIIYMNSMSRVLDISKKIVKHRKPIAISNPKHFRNLLKKIYKDAHLKKSNKDLDGIVEFGGNREKVIQICRYLDLETLIQKTFDKVEKEHITKSYEKYYDTIYSIFGYYYFKYESHFRHKKYTDMKPDITVNSEELYKISSKDFFKFIFKELKKSYQKKKIKAQIPKPLPKRILRLI